MFNEINVATDNMTVAEYKEIYEAIVSLSVDADGYGLFDAISDEDVEKCRWIAAIYEVLDDVPKRRMEHIFRHRKVEFIYSEFFDEIGF